VAGRDVWLVHPWSLGPLPTALPVDTVVIGAALAGARSVRSIAEPHLASWLPRWATCEAAPTLFPLVDRRCDSFSQWWARTSHGLHSAADLLAVNEVTAS